ncbi:MAG: hypothetical protein ABSF99_13825, partial [Anaerolineales bacterium]
SDQCHCERSEAVSSLLGIAYHFVAQVGGSAPPRTCTYGTGTGNDNPPMSLRAQRSSLQISRGIASAERRRLAMTIHQCHCERSEAVSALLGIASAEVRRLAMTDTLSLVQPV